MDIKTILTFQKIVELGTFQRASKELNYAQSTITTHIKNLEEELGVTLIERGRQLQLTEAGKVFYEKGKLLLKGYEQLKDAMYEVLESAVSIKIGVMEPFASYRLPAILEVYKAQYPNAKLTVQIESNSRLLQSVQEGLVDLAICAPVEVPSNFTFSPILQEEVVVLAHDQHPLTDNEVLTLQQLEPFNLLTTSVQCPFRHQFEHSAMKHNFYPKYEMEISNMLALKYYVRVAQDIALVPKIIVSPPPIHTKVIVVDGLEKGLTVGILEKTHKSVESDELLALKQLFMSYFEQSNIEERV